MRILYDGYIFGMQVTGGVNRYFANLIGGLPRDFRPVFLFGERRALEYPSHPRLKVYEYGTRLERLEGFSYRLGQQVARLRDRRVERMAERGSFAVVHPTYYTLLTGRPVGSHRSPTVLTVWDMIHEIFRAEIDPTGGHGALKRSAILAAQKIICISENTKKDLLELVPVPEERVVVTHLASEIDASLSHGPEPVPPRPYYLYVGQRAGYKNFVGLLRAFAGAASMRPHLALCVVGPEFDEGERRLIAELGLAGRIEHYGYANDSHLAKLYRCSLALVYPSRYEGFGIPPLEAMACGTVAVVADVSSLPEVVGDAGLLFDPNALDDLTDILLSLADNESLRQELIEKGARRAEEFSWKKTVAQTLDVYRSLGE